MQLCQQLQMTKSHLVMLRLTLELDLGLAHRCKLLQLLLSHQQHANLLDVVRCSLNLLVPVLLKGQAEDVLVLLAVLTDTRTFVNIEGCESHCTISCTCWSTSCKMKLVEQIDEM